MNLWHAAGCVLELISLLVVLVAAVAAVKLLDALLNGRPS